MTDKTVNYTDEMVDRLAVVYDGSASDAEKRAQIKALAVELGRSEASIRAKLVREKLYVPFAKVDKIDVDVDVIGSLEKATKVALNKILGAL